MAKVLISYFSKSGNTKQMAEYIKEGLDSLGDVDVYLKKVQNTTMSRRPYRAARSLRSKYRISCRTAGSSFVPLSLSTAMSVSSSRPGWQSPEEKTIIVSVRPESGRHMHR